MNIVTLEREIYKLNDREIFYKNNPDYISEYYQFMPKKKIRDKDYYFFGMYKEFASPKVKFFIAKHNRFAYVPPHVHDFIEINYIYSGECIQIIDNHRVHLTKGNIVIIDTGTPHSIEKAKEKDIIINLLIKKDYLLKLLTQNTLQKSLILNFILTSLSNKNNHNQYIVFKNSLDERIRIIIQQILIEKFEQKTSSYEITDHLINVLFTLLVREYEIDIKQLNTEKNRNIYAILAYIDENFDTISLDQVATKFGYSASYLSTLIKKETGRSFSDLVIDKKLALAHTMILGENNNITVCAQKAGFSNITFFYKKYKEKYGCNPGQWKNNDPSISS